MRRLTAVIATTLFAAACGGGVSPANFIQPEVHVRQVALRSAGITGGALDVQLAIANPNHIQVTGTSLQAGLDLQGEHFGDITSNNLFTMAGQDTTLLTLPLNFRWADVGSAAKNILGYGEVNYHLAGNIGIKLPAGQGFTVPFTGDGSVPLVRAVTGTTAP